MLNAPGDPTSTLVNQLNTFFQKPQANPGLNPRQPWEPQAGPAPGPFAPNPGMQLGGVSGAALTGAASGLQVGMLLSKLLIGRGHSNGLSESIASIVDSWPAVMCSNMNCHSSSSALR